MIKKLAWAMLPMAVVFLFDNLLNNPLGFYDRWWWYDIPMHMLGGIVTAWSAVRFFRAQKIIIKPLWALLVLIIGSAAIVGILWEVYEFFMDMVVAYSVQPNVADTVGDLFNDLFGATLFCLVYVKTKHPRQAR